MRLFLTSSGLTNDSLRSAFFNLIAKEISSTKVAFIPTAASIYSDSSWVQGDIDNLKRSGVTSIQTVDISKLPAKDALQYCLGADVIWLNGGNTYYLLEWIRRSGLADEFPSLLKDRIYVGVSAGSMVAGPSVESNTPLFPEEDDHKIDDLRGLDLVPFAVIPHLFSSWFPHSTPDNVEAFASKVSYPIYGIDDASAVEVIDGRIRVVSEGKTCAFNIPTTKI